MHFLLVCETTLGHSFPNKSPDGSMVRIPFYYTFPLISIKIIFCRRFMIFLVIKLARDHAGRISVLGFFSILTSLRSAHTVKTDILPVRPSLLVDKIFHLLGKCKKKKKNKGTLIKYNLEPSLSRRHVCVQPEYVFEWFTAIPLRVKTQKRSVLRILSGSNCRNAKNVKLNPKVDVSYIKKSVSLIELIYLIIGN